MIYQRLAKFNTGFEHKFLCNADIKYIKEFNGQEIDTNDIQYNSYYSKHIWSFPDTENILTILNSFGEGFIMPDFQKYEKNIEGTYKMYTNEPFYLEENEYKNKEKFRIGCLIYHQLLYNNNLSANYEL